MRFGIFSVSDHYPDHIARSLSEFYSELREQARLADELGYYSFWVAEHHFHEYGVVPRPTMLLAAIAQCTKAIKLGSAVAVLPFDNPLRAAEDFAMLDIISGGRLEFGVGSGYLKHEYEGFGLDPEERRGRFDEALELICKSWRGERFSFDGKFFKVDSVQLNVLPLQKPLPPVFVAVLRNEAAFFVGRKQMGILMIPYANTNHVDELRETCTAYLNEYHAAAGSANGAAAGSTNGAAAHGPPRIQFGLHCYCAPTTAEAREFAKPFMDRYVESRLYAKKRPFDELLEKNLIAVGDPHEIVRVARLYENAGLTDVLMIMNFGGLPHEKVQESMKLIAKEVLPEFKNEELRPANRKQTPV